MEHNKITLYKKNTRGKVGVWTIFVRQQHKNGEAHIVTISGQENGKFTESVKKITKGKNIGKGNETSPFDQALLVAESTVKKKRDAGYVSNRNAVNVQIVRPMLAKEYTKQRSHVQFGHSVVVQRKLDGIRCLISLNKKTGKITFTSRTGKQFVEFKEISTRLRNRMSSETEYIDGELYAHSKDFQDIVGIVRKRYITKEDELKMKQISFHAFDYFDLKYPELKFLERYDILTQKIKGLSPFVKLVQIYPLNSPADIELFHNRFVAEGYEGLIIRNNTKYEIGKRTHNLLKFKKFKDSEFKIIGFDRAEGGLHSGSVIWIVALNNKKNAPTFKVFPRGSIEDRIKMYNNGRKNIGKMLTVRYQELSKDGIPRFPIGVGIRDYE